MIVVIQCAASKSADAGCMRNADGQKVFFVADPTIAQPSDSRIYARPDDIADSGSSWRTELLKYNESPGDNPFQLLPAWRLYNNQTYGLLAERVGLDRLYILSAGWGLISASFLTPDYDITFSGSAEKFKRRRKADLYQDLRMLPENTTEEVVFLGGKDYVNQFCDLTRGINAPRTIYYNSATPPVAPGCALQRFETRTRTNWHYECAHALFS